MIQDFYIEFVKKYEPYKTLKETYSELPKEKGYDASIAEFLNKGLLFRKL